MNTVWDFFAIAGACAVGVTPLAVGAPSGATDSDAAVVADGRRGAALDRRPSDDPVRCARQAGRGMTTAGAHRPETSTTRLSRCAASVAPHDAAEADVARRRVHGLALARGGPEAQAVVRRA